jgi:hypothetical protein
MNLSNLRNMIPNPMLHSVQVSVMIPVWIDAWNSVDKSVRDSVDDSIEGSVSDSILFRTKISIMERMKIYDWIM